MNIEMQIIREVNTQAENFYNDAERLGDHAAFALGRDRRSQMTGLENVADNALKVSDIFDYIKRQTARSAPFSYWRKTFSEEKQQSGNERQSGDERQQKDDIVATMGLGERLIHYLEHDLKQKCDTIYSGRFKVHEETNGGQYLKRRIYLLLIRQFVHQMVAEYEFRVNISSRKKGAQ